MPSFVPPQVDHNLYTPILPQDNISQIFALLNEKQQMYNQGVKSVQNKVSSMLNLENEVTSGPVKEMVSDFNGKANDIVKQYANLDFSLQGNVSLIDNIYDPLMSNSLFLADYAATRNLNSQTQVALGYRDSTDADTRSLFNQTNLNALNIKRQNLAGAKSEREIKNYASELANANYTPYYDVQGELVEYMNKLGKDYFKVSRDDANGWTITTTINGKEQQYPSLQTFVKTFLSDKANTQLELESQVNFYSELQNSGASKEQFLSQQIGTSKEQYTNYTTKLKEYIGQVTAKIASYPEDSKLNDIQSEEVSAYRAALESAAEKLSTNEKTLKNLDDYMDKASKGEVEYSRFYDAAESLYVKNDVETKIEQFAAGLVQPESLEVKKNDAYEAMLEENRLSKALQFDMWAKQRELDQKDLEIQQKNAASEQERALKMLELGFATLDENGNIVMNDQGLGADSWVEPSEGPTTVTPTDIAGVNAEFDKIKTEQLENTYLATSKVLSAYSAINNNPLTVEENNWLQKTIKEQSNKSIAQIIKEAGPEAQRILKKAGIANTNEALKVAVAKVITSAEDYVSNTTPDQAGNRLGYHNTLTSVLDEYNERNTINTLQTENMGKAVKKSIDLFKKKYPQYAGLVEFDEATGKVVGKTGNIPDGIQVTRGGEVVYQTKRVDGAEEFNDFLKTQEGSVGAIGNYMKKVLASDAGTFKWLRDPKNKQVYLNPSSYELSTDEYTDSKYYGTGTISGGETWRLDSSEAATYNTIVSKYFNSIDDQRYKLPNKNEMVYGRRVETKKGVTTVFATEEYLRYIFGAGTIDGKNVDKDELVDQPEFNKIVKNIAKYGINIKTPGQSDETSLNILSYINAGNTIPIKKTIGGRSITFKILMDQTTKKPMVEAAFDSRNANDIFLQEDLKYKIVDNAIVPAGDSPAFTFYQSEVTPGKVDTPLIRLSKKNAYTQLTFNNSRNNVQFVTNLQTYLKQYKRPSDVISGADIMAYLAKKP